MTDKRLPLSFFLQPTLKVARQLLGTFLVHESPEGRTVGRIVETEAYRQDDPASHGYRGRTKRTVVMFGPPARAYIYFIYGMHYCFNVVTAREGRAEAVLIRALEPVEGIELMQKRRGRKRGKHFPEAQLCNGPAKLVEAMDISFAQNGCNLNGDSLYLLPQTSFKNFSAIQSTRIAKGPRIGIRLAQEKKWRFWIRGHACVSAKTFQP